MTWVEVQRECMRRALDKKSGVLGQVIYAIGAVYAGTRADDEKNKTPKAPALLLEGGLEYYPPTKR